MFNNLISFLLLTNCSVDNANGGKKIAPFLETKVEVGVTCWCKGQWSRLLDSYGLSNIQPLLSYHLLTDSIFTAAFSGCFRILTEVFFFKTMRLLLESYRLSNHCYPTTSSQAGYVQHQSLVFSFLKTGCIQITDISAGFPTTMQNLNDVSKHDYILWIFFADATFWQTAKSL